MLFYNTLVHTVNIYQWQRNSVEVVFWLPMWTLAASRNGESLCMCSRCCQCHACIIIILCTQVWFVERSIILMIMSYVVDILFFVTAFKTTQLQCTRNSTAKLLYILLQTRYLFCLETNSGSNRISN